MRISKYLNKKELICKLAMSWWVLMISVDRVATELADGVSAFNT